MDWKSFLFSFKGRTTRSQFWIVFVVLPIVWFLLLGVALATPGPEAGVLGAVLKLLLIPYVWINLAAMVKRIHDRNKGALWLVPMILVGGLLTSLGRSVVSVNGSSGQLIIAAGVFLCAWLWPVIELGCLRGTPGDNRFGSPQSLWQFNAPRHVA